MSFLSRLCVDGVAMHEGRPELSGLEGELGRDLAKLLTAEETASHAARSPLLRLAAVLKGTECKSNNDGVCLVLRKTDVNDFLSDTLEEVR